MPYQCPKCGLWFMAKQMDAETAKEHERAQAEMLEISRRHEENRRKWATDLRRKCRFNRPRIVA